MRELGRPNWSDSIQKNESREETAFGEFDSRRRSVPEDHDEIKSEELAALQQGVATSRSRSGPAPLSAKRWGSSWNASLTETDALVSTPREANHSISLLEAKFGLSQPGARLKAGPSVAGLRRCRRLSRDP